MSHSPVLCIVGRSNTGKTTIIERLVQRFKSEGFQVAVVKRDGHDKAVFDYPGKDTWRFTQAGADTVVLATPTRVYQYQKQITSPNLEDLIRGIEPVDIILVEGFKHSSYSKLEVIRAEINTESACQEHEVMGYISDTYQSKDKPVFHSEELDKIIEWIKQIII